MPDALKHESFATFLGHHWLMIFILILAGIWVVEEIADAIRGGD